MSFKVLLYKYVLVSVFFAYIISWGILMIKGVAEGIIIDNWTDSYAVIALIGGLGGLHVAKSWGGWKSYLGRSITLLSWGLIFQFLGQLSYAVHARVFNVENPYPSFGDIFYFGTFGLYAWSMTYMGKVLAIKIGLSRLQSVGIWLLPTTLVLTTWLIFFEYSEFTMDTFFVNILDLAYPLAEAFYVGLTGIAVLYSVKSLGGKLKPYILVIFCSMLLNFFSNSYFMYEDIQGIWRPTGWSDLCYLITYFVLGIGLLNFYDAQKKLKN